MPPLALLLTLALVPGLDGTTSDAPKSGLAVDPPRGGAEPAGPGVTLARAFGVEGEEGAAASLLDSLRFYGSLRVAFVAEHGDAEITNNTSRIGLDLRREFEGGLAVVGRAEWGVNLVESNTRLSVSDNPDGPILETSPGTEPFTSRLGYLGVEGAFGAVTAGKQWSTYYDVAGWTDMFYVYGAEALGVYNAGTDGGPTGTGRADQALVWRRAFGPVHLGLQAQFKGLQSEGNESFGASAVWDVSDAVSLGVAWNRAELGEEAQAILPDLDVATALVVAARYESEALQLALAWAHQTDNEVAFLPGDTFQVFSADGVELYARVPLDERWGVLGGFNWLDPRDVEPPVDPSFELLDGYLGVDYHFDDRTLAYVQGRLAGGTLADGSDRSDSVVLGLRYGF